MCGQTACLFKQGQPFVVPDAEVWRHHPRGWRRRESALHAWSVLPPPPPLPLSPRLTPAACAGLLYPAPCADAATDPPPTVLLGCGDCQLPRRTRTVVSARSTRVRSRRATRPTPRMPHCTRTLSLRGTASDPPNTSKSLNKDIFLGQISIYCRCARSPT